MATKKPLPKKQAHDWLVTSSFQKLNRLPIAEQAKYTAVRTSRGSPRFPLKYPVNHALPLVMPGRDLMDLPEEQFEPRYMEQLDATGADRILRHLEDLHRDNGGERPLALLCFCKLEEGAFCHRRIFSKWFSRFTGKTITEIG